MPSILKGQAAVQRRELKKKGIGQKSKCVITGLPAKYRDPLTGLPYATIEAFKAIRAGQGLERGLGGGAAEGGGSSRRRSSHHHQQHQQQQEPLAHLASPFGGGSNTTGMAPMLIA